MQLIPAFYAFLLFQRQRQREEARKLKGKAICLKYAANLERSKDGKAFGRAAQPLAGFANLPRIPFA